MVALTVAEQKEMVFGLGESLARRDSTREESIMAIGTTMTGLGLTAEEIPAIVPGFSELENRYQYDATPNHPYDPFFTRAFRVSAFGLAAMPQVERETYPNFAEVKAKAFQALIDGAEGQGALNNNMMRVIRGVLGTCIGKYKGSGSYSSVDAVVHLQEVRRLGGFGNVWTDLGDVIRREKAIWKFGGDIYARRQDLIAE